MEFQAIGHIRTPYLTRADMPVQPSGGEVNGHIEMSSEWADGLRDLDGFSHLIVLYLFHCVSDVRLTVIPFLDDQPRGLFATRAPTRPNPIGLSVLRLHEINGNILEVGGVDMLDRTPLIDIKPYVPEFDQPVGEIRTGWLEKKALAATTTRSDGRFGGNEAT